MKLSKKEILFLSINILGIAGIVFFLLRDTEKKQSIQRDLNESYVFTNPIIDCQNYENNTSSAINHVKFKNAIDVLENKYNISRSAVYYRDLANGQWVGINEREVFSPASMMKTPLLIAFLKSVEREPKLLQKKIEAAPSYFEEELLQRGSIETKIDKGASYTLEQLAYYMIEDSDNIATRMLLTAIKQEDVNSLMKSIGSEVEQESGGDVLIRIKDFASFFRILYNASYLSRDMSELALRMLEQTTFKEGLVRGVPADILVAHKYGERQFETGAGGVVKKQFHDCGIIYSKNNPYILCIMTQGEDFENQKKFIAEVSAYVYKQISI